jgi:hypothetical protein
LSAATCPTKPVEYEQEPKVIIQTGPDEATIRTDLERLFDTLDGERLNAMRQLLQLQEAQAAALSTERTRLEAKYATADHPRPQVIAARIQALDTSINALGTALAKAELAMSATPGRLVRGRVVGDGGTAAAGVRVTLTDRDGNELVSNTTGPTGTFTLSVAESEASFADQPLFLKIAEARGTTLYRDPDPLSVPVGTIVERDIDLGAGSESTDPMQNPGELPANVWSARGTVGYVDGTPAAGLSVTLYDLDRLYDDILGSTHTDEQGRFELRYSSADFADLFEKRPDLYLRLHSADGSEIYSSRDAVRVDAGQRENFSILLEKPSG